MQVSQGTLLGHDHWINGALAVGKNNQDAMGITENIGYWCGVVADGCGSGAHSEIGARIGIQAVLRAVELGAVSARSLNTVVNRHLDMFYTYHLPPGKQTVNDYMLFTLIGIIIDKMRNHVRIFGCGDGVYSWGGSEQPKVITCEGNMPPYMGYNLITPGKCEIIDYVSGDAEEMLPAVVGTDGLGELPFWHNNYPDWVSRGLCLTRIFRKNHRLLHDDTTAIAVGL